MKRISILVLVLCACFASVAWGQQPAAKVRDWRQFHRLDMQRMNPFENVLNVHNVGKLGLKWSYDTGAGDFGVAASPAVANGVVYVGSDVDVGSVYALDASTGAVLWSYATGGQVYSSPAVANGVVYVGSDDGKVYALNAKTGVKLWSYPAGVVFSSPAVANGVVYVGSGDFNERRQVDNVGGERSEPSCGQYRHVSRTTTVVPLPNLLFTAAERRAELEIDLIC